MTVKGYTARRGGKRVTVRPYNRAASSKRRAAERALSDFAASLRNRGPSLLCGGTGCR